MEVHEDEPLDLNDELPPADSAAKEKPNDRSEASDPSERATASAATEQTTASTPVTQPTPDEMAEIHSLVAQLVGDGQAPLNSAHISTTFGLQPLTTPHAEIVERAEDVARACEALERRAAVAIACVSDGDGIRYLAAGVADRTMVFDIRKVGAWPEPLRTLLEGPLPKIVHKLGHAPRMLLQHADVELGNVADLYAAAVLTDGYSRERSADNYGLGALVARVLRRSLSRGSHEHEAARLAREVAAMVNLYSRLRSAASEAKVEKVWRRENEIVVPIAAVESAGFRLDVAEAECWHVEAEQQREAAQERLRPIVGDINLDSQDELRAALGAVCGFAFTSTSRLHLRRLTKSYPFLKDVIAFRRGSMHEQHLRSWLDAARADGQVHATFDSLAAATGRMGCSDPPLQSAPRELRSLFVAAPGDKLVIADYSAIELAIIADQTQDTEMITCFKRGIDLHRRTAGFIVGKRPEDVTDGERTGAKAINFGFSYAMGVTTFLEHAEENYGLLYDEAFGKAARAKFFTLYAGVAKWHERVGVEGPKNLDLRTPSGRLRRFAEFDFPSYINTPIQGVGACGFKQALALSHSALQALGARIVHLQHDEFVIEVPEDAVSEVSKVVEEMMIQGMSEFVTRVPIRVKVTVADSWAKS